MVFQNWCLKTVEETLYETQWMIIIFGQMPLPKRQGMSKWHWTCGGWHPATDWHQFVKCQVIFNMKMEICYLNTKLVTLRHMTNMPTMVRYDSVASRETVKIVLTMIPSKELNVMTVDTLDAYTITPRKIWTLFGPNFKKNFC